jgi:hypothetical protein
MAPLDPAVSRRILDHTRRLPASKSADTNDRMRVTAGGTVPSCRDNSACGTPANTDASVTGPSLPVVDERYAARSRKVRSSTNRTRMRASRSASPRLRLTPAPAARRRSATSPPPRVPVPALQPRAVDRTRRARRVVGARRGDVPLVLNEGGFRQAPQAAPKVSPSEAVGGEGVCRDFQAATVPCHLVPASRGPARHIDTRRSTSPAVTARRPPAEIGSSSSGCVPTA